MLTPAQQRFLEKLKKLKDSDKAKSPKQKRLVDAAQLATALLDLLPDSPVLAVIVAQISEANQETIDQIWDLFGHE